MTEVRCCVGRTRTGQMLAMSLAVAVVLMCRGHLEDKYRGMCMYVCTSLSRFHYVLTYSRYCDIYYAPPLG